MLHSQRSKITEFLDAKKTKKSLNPSKEPAVKARKTAKITEKVNKLYNDAVIKRGRIEKIAVEMTKNESKEATFKPRINSNSDKLVRRKNMIPIHERYQEVLQQKEKVVKRIKHQIMQEKVEKYPEDFYCDFRPSLDLSQMAVAVGSRDFESFLKHVNLWNEKKMDKTMQGIKSKWTKERQSCSYRPQITKKAIQLFESKYGKDKNWAGFLERENAFLEKVNSEKREKIEREMDSYFFPITENRIKELRSKSTFDGILK